MLKRIIINEKEFGGDSAEVLCEMYRDGVLICKYKEFYDYGGSLCEMEVVEGDVSWEEIWKLFEEAEG